MSTQPLFFPKEVIPPMLGYCDSHQKTPAVITETDLTTGVKKRMCKQCWDKHRGRDRK